MNNERYMIIEVKYTPKDGKDFIFNEGNLNSILYKNKEECMKRLDEIVFAFKESREKYDHQKIVAFGQMNDGSYYVGFMNKKSQGIYYHIFKIVTMNIPGIIGE